MDITKIRDNFEGTETELKNIAKTVYECVEGSNTNPWTFMDECESMLCCDYDFLNENQFDEAWKLINELIRNEGKFHEENKFFIFNNHEGFVSVVGKFEDEGNLDMFSLDFENIADAEYLARELEPIVKFMNYQDRLINNK